MGKKVFITITGTNHYLGDEYDCPWHGEYIKETVSFP